MVAGEAAAGARRAGAAHAAAGAERAGGGPAAEDAGRGRADHAAAVPRLEPPAPLRRRRPGPDRVLAPRPGRAVGQGDAGGGGVRVGPPPAPYREIPFTNATTPKMN